ncbi:flavin reductase family protein [uncultured Jatrophihabitans sp.]|uniref:flavin reductase family protein n=1 Tax=uncultured Jatrophihabitans sp. TaxID=1610747 RepID=UPI0035CC5BCC
MPERLELSAADVGRDMYPWLNCSIIPRAIAWVSTISADGVDNVAPHSFTTVAGTDPATLCFTSVGAKDTLANVRATGEFVLNVGTWHQLHGMNDTATDFPGALSEFDAAGLEREPSTVVAPPRVRDAPVAFECRVSGEHVVGTCVMVFGEVVHLAAHTSVLAEDGRPDARLVDPLARLGRNEWSRLGELVAIDRIRYEDWTDGRRSAG